jgi:hypothetical protein
MWLLSPQLIILLAAMSLSATAGWRVTANHYQKEIAQTELERIQAVEKARQLSHALSVAGLELSGVIWERDAARLEKRNKAWEIVYVDVIRYRDKPQKPAADGYCYLDGEWIRLHDAARIDGVPETTGAPSGPDESTTYANAIETVARNYREYSKCRSTVIGWQEFYEGVRRLHEH